MDFVAALSAFCASLSGLISIGVVGISLLWGPLLPPLPVIGLMLPGPTGD